MKLHNTFLTCKTSRLDNVKYFSFELGMKRHIYLHIVEISIFSVNNVIYRQTCQNYEQPP